MKISNGDEIQKSMYREPTPKNEKSTYKQFSEILKETLSPTQEDKPVSQGHPIIKASAPLKIQPAMALEENKSVLVEGIDKLLNTLEDYRLKLGNPQMSLKEVDPLVNRLDSENENLKPVLESLAEGEKLKEILNEVLVTTSLEVIKYKRGDYNPTEK